jgi:hypothetical protein
VYPIGAVIQGQIANHIGVRAVTVGGAVILLAVLVVVATFRPQLLAALDDLRHDASEIVPTEELP